MEKPMNNHTGRGDNSDVAGGKAVRNAGLEYCRGDNCGVADGDLQRGHTGAKSITGQCKSDGNKGC